MHSIFLSLLALLHLWATYKPYTQRPFSRTTTTLNTRGIDHVISALVYRSKLQEGTKDDEFNRWKTQEPR
jgi:hypothetical protein